MSETEQHLRNEARALLEQGKVDTIVGYETGSLKFTTTPLITRDRENTDRLVINPFIANNLSVFLREINGKTGIVAKACDCRSIVSLIQDKQIDRENVYIIGVPCHGIIDLNKVSKLTEKDGDEIDDIALSGDKAVITIDGIKKEYPATDVLRDDCLACDDVIPKEYDILLGEPRPPAPDLKLSGQSIASLKELTSEQRWESWKKRASIHLSSQADSNNGWPLPVPLPCTLRL